MATAVQHLPETGFVRQPVVVAHVGFSKSTLWVKVAKGQFPKPLKLGPRITAWRVEDIRAWIDARAAEADRLRGAA
jgi:prophage regulatory protein